MSDWEIRIPHRSRDDSLVDVATAARHLENPDDRQVARQLALDVAIDGLTTAGQLLDRLETADPAARRVLLDHARQRAGLPTTSEVEDHLRYEAASLGWPRTGEPQQPVADLQCRQLQRRAARPYDRHSDHHGGEKMVVSRASRSVRAGRLGPMRVWRTHL